jgi:serine O-acetyltransferase
MITSKEDYLAYLEADRIALGRKKQRFVLFTLDPIWSFIRLLRTIAYYENCKKSKIWLPYYIFLKLRMKRMKILLGYELPIHSIGPGLYLAHIGPIVMSPACKVGKNLRLNINIVIGEKGGQELVPTIGNNVTIEAGSKLFGKIEIADGIHIGANSVVNKSFLEKNIIIAGVPAKKIGEKKVGDTTQTHCK